MLTAKRPKRRELMPSASAQVAAKAEADMLLSPRVLREIERLTRIAAASAGRPHESSLTPTQLAVAQRRWRNLRAAPWANKKAIRAIYAEAKRLTAETGIPHHVDHEIPLQGDFVSGLHVETNLRVMIASDNIAKGNRIKADL